jgi:hypothetical protein
MMVNPLAGLVHRLGFKERNETGLPKMMIRGESIANAELAHSRSLRCAADESLHRGGNSKNGAMTRSPALD